MKNKKKLLVLIYLTVLFIVPFRVFSQGIEIQNGGSIVNTGNTSIEIYNGGFINNGTYSKGSEIVTFSGTEGALTGGLVNTNFNDLSITNTGGITTQFALMSVKNLTIALGSSFIIDAGKAVTVGENLTNNSVSGSLKIKSDETGTGSLIVVGTPTGSLTFESYLAEAGKWHVAAAPVAAQNIWSFAVNAENNIASKTGKRAVTEYLEGTNTWDTNYPTGDTEGSFATGSGYSVLRATPGIVAYTGNFNANDVSIQLKRTLYGWNALGNPYPSAIVATETAHPAYNLITANLDKFDPAFAALYLWDAATSQYVTINNAGSGTLVQNYIQAGQGFFIRAKDNSGLNFSITENMRSHQTTLPLKSADTPWPVIQLTISGNGKQSNTLITFNNRMTNGLDISYDAGMFKADKNFALYSRLVDDNGIDFAIQALPENYSELVIPLGIDVSAGTEINFSALTENLPITAAVYLEDKNAGTITQLDVKDKKYTVTVTDKTKGTGNFFLHTSATATAVNDLKNNIVVYTHDKAVYIDGNLNNNDLVSVFGIDGKLHYRNTAAKTGLLRIDASKMPAGIYLVKIDRNNENFTRKIILGN
jgi:hypothetical protein